MRTPNDIAAEVAFRWKHSIHHQYRRYWKNRWQVPLGLAFLSAVWFLVGRAWS